MGKVGPRSFNGPLVINEQTERPHPNDLGIKALNTLPFDVPPQHAGDLIIAPSGHVDPYRGITSFNDPARFIAFSADRVPLLVKDGWQVAFSDDYPYRIAEGDAQWWADIGEGSGIDWFSFELASSSKAIESDRPTTFPPGTRPCHESGCRYFKRCWTPGRSGISGSWGSERIGIV